MAMNQVVEGMEAEDTQQGRYLLFSLGEENFGLEIRYITEIIGVYPITTLPGVPAYVKGIINLRSKIIPVIDMRIKFNKPTVPYTDRTCILVIELREVTVGLIVDTVAEVVTIEEENIVPPPEGKMSAQDNYLRGIGTIEDEVKLLLDCEQLLNDAQYAAIE